MTGVGVLTLLVGLLFGYDQGSGVLPLLMADPALSTLESEVIMSWVTPGALFGGLGEPSVFFLFSAGGVTFVFVSILVPETKDRSHEEIQERRVLGRHRMLDEESM